jgi:hypothetical protein
MEEPSQAVFFCVLPSYFWVVFVCLFVLIVFSPRPPRSGDVTIRSDSMSGRALINSLPISSVDTDFFAADASEFYRHANQPIFLVP